MFLPKGRGLTIDDLQSLVISITLLRIGCKSVEELVLPIIIVIDNESFVEFTIE